MEKTLRMRGWVTLSIMSALVIWLSLEAFRFGLGFIIDTEVDSAVVVSETKVEGCYEDVPSLVIEANPHSVNIDVLIQETYKNNPEISPGGFCGTIQVSTGK